MRTEENINLNLPFMRNVLIILHNDKHIREHMIILWQN